MVALSTCVNCSKCCLTFWPFFASLDSCVTCLLSLFDRHKYSAQPHSLPSFPILSYLVPTWWWSLRILAMSITTVTEKVDSCITPIIPLPIPPVANGAVHSAPSPTLETSLRSPLNWFAADIESFFKADESPSVLLNDMSSLCSFKFSNLEALRTEISVSPSQGKQ